MIIEILNQQFFENALMAGLLVSVAAGIIGSLVVVMRKVFIAGGIAHSAYGGVGLAHLLGVPPLIGGLVVSAIAAVIMGVMERRAKQRSDTVIGMVWAVGMAIGVIAIDLTKGYAVNLMSFLFGSIIAIASSDLLLMVIADIIIVATIGVLYNDLLAYAFDREFALLMNRKSRYCSFIFLILTSLTVVIMIRLVGLILVIALLTIPATIAERFTKKLKTMMLASIILNAVILTAGLFAATIANVSAGATIIVIAACSYGFVVLGERIVRFAKRAKA